MCSVQKNKHQLLSPGCEHGIFFLLLVVLATEIYSSLFAMFQNIKLTLNG